MRDPFVTRGPDQQFHMVWTWGWRGQSIGHATSKDLVHWSEQREIPLMAGTPGTRNTWAPEIYWDEAKSEWMIVFSSVVEGRHEGNRLYSARTRDFRTVSKPEIFFDPGYPVIDATLIRARGRYYMIFKDERNEPLHRWLAVASGPTLAGPWTGISEPFTVSWSEGPSVVKVGDEYLVYYDHYREPKRYEAARSEDLEHWTSATDRVQFPADCKHGSFLRITQAERKRIEAAQ
jgi:beta-xylosidase